MEHRVGATPYPFYPHSSRGRVKKGHELARTVSQVLVGLTSRLSLRLPATSGVGYSLERTGLIEPPHRQTPELLAIPIGAFDQIFWLRHLDR
jgi:hypothetical protein